MTGKVVALIAPTRSGKSFLVEQLAKYYRAPARFELEEGGIPQDLSDSMKEGTSVEPWLYFRNRCVRIQKEAEELAKSNPLVFVDSTWLSCPPYISYYRLSDTDRRILEEVSALDRVTLRCPDLLVSLKISDEESEKYWKLSGKEFERGQTYFSERVLPLKRAFEKYLAQIRQTFPLLEINRSGLDFSNPEHVALVAKKIDVALA